MNEAEIVVRHERDVFVDIMLFLDGEQMNMFALDRKNREQSRRH